MARVAIVGPGAIGGVMAAWLGRTHKQEIILCARRVLNELTIETPSETIVIHPTVLTDPRQAQPVDWVLVATKTYDAEGAAAWFEGLRGGRSPVAILQNGVEHRERFSRYLPAERILPVVVECPAERVEPTRIRQRGEARLTVPDGKLGREFARLFADSEVEVLLTSDFKSAAWRKLCLNAVGVLPALLLMPNKIMHDDEIGAVAHELVRECLAVGRAEGAVLSDELIESVLQQCRAAPPDSINSLHADRLAGRPTEIDARNGAIVRLGRKHGIATPFNQMAVVLLNAMNRPSLASG